MELLSELTAKTDVNKTIKKVNLKKIPSVIIPEKKGAAMV